MDIERAWDKISTTSLHIHHPNTTKMERHSQYIYASHSQTMLTWLPQQANSKSSPHTWERGRQWRLGKSWGSLRLNKHIIKTRERLGQPFLVLVTSIQVLSRMTNKWYMRYMEGVGSDVIPGTNPHITVALLTLGPMSSLVQGVIGQNSR